MHLILILISMAQSLFDNLIVIQLVKKFLVYEVLQMFIHEFKRARR